MVQRNMKKQLRRSERVLDGRWGSSTWRAFEIEVSGGFRVQVSQMGGLPLQEFGDRSGSRFVSSRTAARHSVAAIASGVRIQGLETSDMIHISLSRLFLEYARLYVSANVYVCALSMCIYIYICIYVYIYIIYL